MKNVLVTGAKGQLGLCINELAIQHPKIKFTFTSSKELDITDVIALKTVFNTNSFDYCINCAAYTAVDKAEHEKEQAFNVNVNGVKNLATLCKEKDVVLIHISTDFVFDGYASKPYKEKDTTNPLSVYGKTKLKGEEEIKSILKRYFIIRTSWLYSEYANNFMKTMLRLGQERKELNVVSDQIGTPTYAKDLADVLLTIIDQDSNAYGLYHYANKGVTSWFGFAQQIFNLANIDIRLNNIPTIAYPTPAARPKYSVLSKNKIIDSLKIKIPNWEESLQIAINNFN